MDGQQKYSRGSLFSAMFFNSLRKDGFFRVYLKMTELLHQSIYCRESD
jgi:hypothetical protein